MPPPVDKRVRKIVDKYVTHSYPDISLALQRDRLSCNVPGKRHRLIVGYNPGVTGILYSLCCGYINEEETERRYCRSVKMKLLSYQFSSARMNALLREVGSLGDRDAQDQIRTTELEADKQDLEVIRSRVELSRLNTAKDRCGLVATRIAELVRLRRETTSVRIAFCAQLENAEAQYRMRDENTSSAEKQILRTAWLQFCEDYMRSTYLLRSLTQEELVQRDLFEIVFRKHNVAERPIVPAFQVFGDPSEQHVPTLTPYMVTDSAPRTPRRSRIPSSATTSAAATSSSPAGTNSSPPKALKTIGTIVLNDDGSCVTYKEDEDGNLVIITEGGDLDSDNE